MGSKDITYSNYFFQFGLKLTVRDFGEKQLFLLDVRTTGMSNWLFVESVEIYDSHDYDNNKRLKLILDDVNRDTISTSSGVFVAEGQRVILTKEQLNKLYFVLKNSKKVTMRFEGKTHYDDQLLQSFQKEEVLKTIEYYKNNYEK